MTAQDFLKDFQQIFVDRHEEAAKSYCSNKDYTTFIIGAIDQMIVNRQYKTQKEYFRIDAIGWTPIADQITHVHAYGHRLRYTGFGN